MHVVITGGGTGGHLAIARALGEALIERGHEVLFIGSTSGQDRKWFEGYSDFSHAYFLETTGVVNRKGFKKAAALWRVFRAFLRSRKLLRRHRADAVISVGGFSAAPASLAAISRKIPLFIHEQNAVEGRLNRMLKPHAKAFFNAYDEASPVKGYPVGEALFARARVRSKVKTLIFLGGSQGARFINDLALEVAPACVERGIRIIHQCGERDYERVKAAYEAMGIDAELYGFTKELPSLLEKSDLAVSRAGASTLWELCANGLPALFIPYPHAAGDHQFYNARFIVRQELGWCERESEGVAQVLLNLLDEELEAKSRALMANCEKDAAERTVAYIEGAL
jgi:UDP-N-acetylglucosamine--N-acetylmuramyl-(pentapeptide) pyrophosphoryl-undecaprenol N-acetylglucosamine transferase